MSPTLDQTWLLLMSDWMLEVMEEPNTHSIFEAIQS